MRAFFFALLLTLRVVSALESTSIVGLPPLAAELVQEAQSLASHRLDSCFREAYSALVTLGCKQLHEHGKRRLALMFSNCHLSSSGRPPAPCASDEPLEDCGARMTGESFSSYTSFTTHVDALCYYLESSQWQAATWDMVQALLSGANETALRLSSFASDVQTHQAAALAAAQALAVRQEAMGSQLASTERRVGDVVGVLDRVAVYAATAVQLQGYVVGNLLILHVGIFYSGAAAFIWMFTSTRRTSGARLTLLAGLAACAVAEAYIVTHWTDLAALVDDAAEAAARIAYAPVESVAEVEPLSGHRSANDQPPLVAVGGWASRVIVSWSWLLVRAAAALAARAGIYLYRVVWGAIGVHSQARPLFDALSAALWDLSGIQAALRWAFVAWAAAVLLHTAAAYVEYGRESLAVLRALQRQVDRLASEAASSAAAALRAGDGQQMMQGPVLLYDIPGAPVAAARAAAIDSPAGALAFSDPIDDDSEDGEYFPDVPNADAAARAAESSARAMADFAVGLPLLSPPSSPASEQPAALAHVASLALTMHQPLLVLRRSLRRHPPAPPLGNPILAFESADAFAQLVTLRRLSSLLELREEAAAARLEPRSGSAGGAEVEEEEDGEGEWTGSSESSEDASGDGDSSSGGSDGLPSPQPGGGGAGGVIHAEAAGGGGEAGAGVFPYIGPGAGLPPAAPALAGQRRRRASVVGKEQGRDEEGGSCGSDAAGAQSDEEGAERGQQAIATHKRQRTAAARAGGAESAAASLSRRRSLRLRPT